MNKNLSLNIRNLLEQFISRKPNIKESTKNNIRVSVLNSLFYLEKSSLKKGLPSNISQTVLIRCLNKMKKRYLVLHTIIPRMCKLYNFLEFLKNNGCLKKNPLELLKKKYSRKGLKAIILALMKPDSKKLLKELTPLSRFTSPLGKDMQNFIMFGRSLGKDFCAEEQILCCFDRFLTSYSRPPKQLSDSIIKEWLHTFSSRSPAHRYKNFGTIRRFCLYLRRFDSKIYVPDKSYAPISTQSFIPHIYSEKEIAGLLKAFRQSKPSRQFSIRPQMLYVLCLLLYTTGMRISEALKLQLKDIDWIEEKLYIRETKFFKSRTVPLSSSMVKELKHYHQLRKQEKLSTSAEAFLFQNPHRYEPYDNSTISKLFRQTLWNLGLKSRPGYNGPRIHDLRHTFATRRLEKWYQQGIDVQSRLGLLSTYLGHTGIKGTQRYLTMTTELLQQASKRFNQYFTQK